MMRLNLTENIMSSNFFIHALIRKFIRKFLCIILTIRIKLNRNQT